MGNANKKKKAKGNEENKKTSENVNNSKITDQNIVNEIKEILEKPKNTQIKLNLINTQDHSAVDDKIEEVFTIPDLPNTIIIGCRAGDIKEISEVSTFHQLHDFSNILTLYSFSKRLYSLILLNKTTKLCAGLQNEIVILQLKLKDMHKLEKENEYILKSEGPIHSLLELKNGNIISAGSNIILWQKNSSLNYEQVKSISIGNSRIINLVEFPDYNTIIATQENTHILYLLKNNGNSIDLIQNVENVPSIWYKGSAQYLSKNAMLLVGKFELNAIDSQNGVVISRYPGIDKGTLLKIKLQGKDFWIVSDFYGKYFEFYEQEDNDLLFYEKVELEDNEIYKWGHKLVKINDEIFAATNHYGRFFVYQIIKNK